MTTTPISTTEAIELIKEMRDASVEVYVVTNEQTRRSMTKALWDEKKAARALFLAMGIAPLDNELDQALL